ncbi:MAG: hypothetical protein U5L03_01985 [Burkholderiaceae bacterium]|nr:hypothetical protein [Burkholderiaceae bacterium]
MDAPGRYASGRPACYARSLHHERVAERVGKSARDLFGGAERMTVGMHALGNNHRNPQPDRCYKCEDVCDVDKAHYHVGRSLLDCRAQLAQPPHVGSDESQAMVGLGQQIQLDAWHPKGQIKMIFPRIRIG